MIGVQYVMILTGRDHFLILTMTLPAPVRTQHEFVYHHALREFVMLVRWLPSHEADQIPPYAHSMVGVGGMVIAEDRDEVLVVREKYYKQPHWKLPGGFVEPGEATPSACLTGVHVWYNHARDDLNAMIFALG